MEDKDIEAINDQIEKNVKIRNMNFTKAGLTFGLACPVLAIGEYYGGKAENASIIAAGSLLILGGTILMQNIKINRSQKRLEETKQKILKNKKKKY